MRLTRSRLLLAGIVTFVVTLVLAFPARVAYRWFAPAGVHLSGVSGTIWSGGAAEGDAAGLYLRDVSWRVRPLSVFTGTIEYAAEASLPSGFIHTRLGVTLAGNVRLSGMRGSVPLESLADSVRMPGLRGKVNLDFERLVIADGLPVAVDGTLDVVDLVAPLIDRGPIGGYRAEFQTSNEGVVAAVEDTTGVVNLAGSLTIAPDRSYRFLGKLAPKPETPAHLVEQMRYLGTADDRGQYDLRLEGRL